MEIIQLQQITLKSTLSYFFIGFDKQEIVVAGRTKIDVKMSTDSQILEEVVIVGYGSSRSKELTGAAAKVKGENIEKLNLSRMDQAQDRFRVNISTNSGSPGGHQVSELEDYPLLVTMTHSFLLME